MWKTLKRPGHKKHFEAELGNLSDSRQSNEAVEIDNVRTPSRMFTVTALELSRTPSV